MTHRLSDILKRYQDCSNVVVAGGTSNNSDITYAPVNYTALDSDINTHLEGIDNVLSTKVFRTNRQDISSNIYFNNQSPNVQNLLNKSGMVLTVNLPNSPIKDTLFIVKNRLGSTNELSINGVILLPGEMWEGIWDGAEWIEI